MTGSLDSGHAVTKLPARDLDRARRFYRDRLGLEPVEKRTGGLRYLCGRRSSPTSTRARGLASSVRSFRDSEGNLLGMGQATR